jgi:hypothetical protein
MIELVAQDKLDAALEQKVEGLEADRKNVLLGHIRCAIGRNAGAELHENFSNNLQEPELAFYNSIVVVTPDESAAGSVAAPQSNPPPISPEAAAAAHSEGSRAAEAESARSRTR